ncbi:MAG: hypothetical protein WC330_04115 [Candidatus Omnitrophota bacterium]|jgi:hypothetical protein
MKSKKKMRSFKKSIKHFIKDENGFIEKDKVIKLGLGTISALTVISSLSAPKNAYAAHTNTTDHSNGLVEEAVAGTTCRRLKPVDATTHNNHSSGGK